VKVNVAPEEQTLFEACFVDRFVDSGYKENPDFPCTGKVLKILESVLILSSKENSFLSLKKNEIDPSDLLLLESSEFLL
jgi:hypothetical protein